MRFGLCRSTLNWLLFFLLTFSVLWKGGKALDATWMLAVVACFVTLADAACIPRSEKSSPPTTLWLLGLSFVLWTAVSFWFSTAKNYGFDEMMQAASLFLLFDFALCIHVSDVQKFSSRFARILSVATLVACTIGVAVYALQPVSRFVGTFFDFRFNTDYWPNAWAEFLLFSWPMVLWCLYGRKLKTEAPVAKVFVMGLVIGCLLLSYSRGAIIVLFLQIGFLSALLLCCRRRFVFSFGSVFRKFAAVFLASVMFFLLINELRSRFNSIESVMQKATFTASEGKSSVSERRQFFEQSLLFALEKPLFGHGPYSFRFLQPHVQRDVLATSDHAHNVFLKLAMERGVTASLLFLLIVVWCFYSGLKSALETSRSEDSILAFLLLTSVLGVLLHNLIDYNLQFVGISAPLWISLGLLVRRTEIPKGAFPWKQSTASLLALCLLVVSAIEARYLFISFFARRAERSGMFSESLLLYSRTTNSLFPRDGWLSRGRMLIAGGDFSGAQAAIGRGMALNRQDYRVWKLQGDLLIRQNDREKALRAFAQAYEYGRYNDLGITRVLVELLQADRKALDARRNEFENLLNDFGLAIEENTHFIDLSSNVEELVKLCALFASIYPADAALYTQLSDRSMEHALLERSRLNARPRGLLW
ncbi:hypothetical protein EXS65_01775 [Candidatus Peribacteria bacterium]|nr:hypothetical protein [Candidatus Peribacteria bacterium]